MKNNGRTGEYRIYRRHNKQELYELIITGTGANFAEEYRYIHTYPNLAAIKNFATLGGHGKDASGEEYRNAFHWHFDPDC